tara:strand:- start:78 stop:206 length:129 start_codon:yes stop_codon:yes gene_type:complete
MTAPNILLIMADQRAPYFTGAYGHKFVKKTAFGRLGGPWDAV